MFRVILDQPALVTRYVYSKIPELEAPDVSTATMGFADENGFCAGVVFTNFRGNDIEILLAAEHARWASRRTFGIIFAYPFKQLNCNRATAICNKKNARIRKLLNGVGFREEGKVREGFDNGDDAMIYGMLKRECRWIGEGHRQKVPRQAADAA